MDLSLNEDQLMLQNSIERFLQDNYSFEQRERLRVSEAGFSSEHWKQYAELGWLSLPFSEDEGGLGFGAVEMMILMQQFGRFLVLEPYLSTVILGGSFLRHAAQERRAEWLQKLMAGHLHCAFAFAEAQSRFNPAHVAVRAERKGEGWKLQGDKTVVLNGAAANLFIVSARTSGTAGDEEGVSLFAVDAGAPGLTRRGYTTFDGGRAAEISLQDVEVGTADLIGAEGKGVTLIQEVLCFGLLGLGAEAVGCMEIIHADTLEYSRVRKQFGVPIGTFQVLQHRMVDIFMEVEQSLSLLYMTAVRVNEGAGATTCKASSALKAQVGRAGRFVGQQAVQIHGGMGVSDELRLSHYFKRLTAIEHTFGNSDFHLRRFIESV